MQIRLSPSAIACFKRDPLEYRLKYIEGIVPIETADQLRMGTNWHEMQEEYQNLLAAGEDPDTAFDHVIELLNDRYTTIPPNKTAREWAEERTALAVGFAGYNWYWNETPFETLATEQLYKLPLLHPKVGMPLNEKDVILKGKIDRIVRWGDRVLVLEHKTTSRIIGGDSTYWDQWRTDGQLTSYVYAVRELQHRQRIKFPSLCSGVLMDVFRKPSISMKKLSQKDTASLIETGEYFGTQFDVKLEDGAETAWVDNVQTDVEWGKSGNPAIYETPEMYGARLLADMYENPANYFARREVARTDADIERYMEDVYAVYHCICTMLKTGHWFHNERASQPGYKSEYDQLFQMGDVTQFCDGVTTPDGFERIYKKEPAHG